VGGHLDITQTKQLEARLAQSQRMEALGTLTAGVAHNFNNLLAIILPSLDLLRPHVSSAGLELLGDIRAASVQAAAVIRQLMAYTRSQESARADANDLVKLVEESVRLHGHALDPSIRIEFDLPVQPALVSCDGPELQQVFVNLIANAEHALLASAGGSEPRITVSISLVPELPEGVLGDAPEADWVQWEPQKDGYWVVSVADTGPGMSAEVRKRVFEPFFTTKLAGGGTGLGLAMAWSVVRALGGHIDVRSELGAGAVFRVYLPNRADLALAQPSVAVPNTSMPRRRILIVEDADFVRKVVGRILASAGHEVLEAESAGRALDVARGEAIHTIFLDQSLPDRPGTAIIEELRSLQPSARLLLFTGESVAPNQARRVDGVVHKPASEAQLLDAIGFDTD
jgi:nitrogen-specific signal transduction histidine kinase/CheY-like chemotaxis protein